MRADAVSASPIAEVVFALAEYAIAIGAAPLSQYAGPWTHQITDDLWVVVNGRSESAEYVDPSAGASHTIAPFDAHFYWRGWPAVIAGPGGGVTMDRRTERGIINTLRRLTAACGACGERA